MRAYLNDMRAAEAKLNYKALKIEPVLDGQQLQFYLSNVGNVDLELLMLEIRLPVQVMGQSFIGGTTDGVDSRIVSMDNASYRWIGYYSPRGLYGRVQLALLPPILTPSMGKFHPETYLQLHAPPQVDYTGISVYFQAHAIGYRMDMEERRLAELIG